MFHQKLCFQSPKTFTPIHHVCLKIKQYSTNGRETQSKKEIFQYHMYHVYQHDHQPSCEIFIYMYFMSNHFRHLSISASCASCAYCFTFLTCLTCHTQVQSPQTLPNPVGHRTEQKRELQIFQALPCPG